MKLFAELGTLKELPPDNSNVQIVVSKIQQYIPMMILVAMGILII